MLEELASQLLRQGGRLRVKARGSSMLPFILDGEVVLVAPAAGAELRVGDVVCYETPPGTLVLHRVIGRRGERLVTKGDALTSTDVISRARVLGRVVAVERRGRLRRLDTRAARWRNAAVAALAPVLPRLLPLAIGARRAWRAARHA